MLYPTIFGEGLFDDLMNFSFPRFRDFDDTERKLYGKNAAHVMKTDVREHDDQFEVDIDLPGFKKEEIQLNLESGYLTVSAAKALEEDKNNKQGKLIRQERYTGTMQRSFYVGENLLCRRECDGRGHQGEVRRRRPEAQHPEEGSGPHPREEDHHDRGLMRIERKAKASLAAKGRSSPEEQFNKATTLTGTA